MGINELLKEVSQITKRHHEVRVMDYMEMTGAFLPSGKTTFFFLLF